MPAASASVVISRAIVLRPPAGGKATTVPLQQLGGSERTRLVADELLFVLELQLVEAVVDASLREELLMRSRLAELTLVHDQDPVHALNRRQPVRDGDRRPASHRHLERIANEQLGIGIDARRRLIENQHARI